MSFAFLIMLSFSPDIYPPCTWTPNCFNDLWGPYSVNIYSSVFSGWSLPVGICCSSYLPVKCLHCSRPTSETCLSLSMTINLWREGISHLWQEWVGTIRKGRVTWCVLSPLPVAWAGICVGAFASGPGSVGLHLLWLLSSCQLLFMTSETSQTSVGLHMKWSGHSALWEQTVSQPA